MFAIGRRGTEAGPAGVLCALLAFVSSACVTQGTYDELAAEKQDLERRNAQLEEEVGAARTERDQLADELGAERQNFDELRATYDELLGELSVEVASGKIAVEQMQSGVNVRIADDVLFGSGSAELDAKGKEIIERLAGELQDVSYQIVVGGYTDDVPIGGKLAERYPTNWDLAGARAASVVSVLEASGIPSRQLLAVSFGDSVPVASNDTPEGRALNRRIEVRIRPVEFEEAPPAVAAPPPE